MSDVLAIVQARMGSSRLPGKSLAELGGVPIIDWVYQRLSASQAVSKVVVATTTEPQDDPLVTHLENCQADVVRGHPTDVLHRFGTVLEAEAAEWVVRITADNPFVQPELIDAAVEQAAGVRYVYSGHTNRMPRGFDLEVVHRSALEEALAQAVAPEEREHVTPYIARRPEVFESRMFDPPQWARRGDLRFTVDERDDLAALRAIVDGMGALPATLAGPDLIQFCDQHPEIVALNAGIAHRTVL